MKLTLFILIFAMPFVVFGETWTKLNPFPECKEFFIEYQESNVTTIRYKESPSSKYTIYKNKLLDINNLSILAEDLTVAAQNFCGSNLTIQIINEEYRCLPQKFTTDDLSPEVVSVFDQIITTVKNKNTNCDNVLGLIKAQSTITGLNQQQVLEFEEVPSLYKLATVFSKDKEKTNALIDQFKACGGRDFSKKFLTNIIMLETKNSCLYPTPPGGMTYKEAFSMAEEISKKYKDTSLLRFYRKKDKITKHVIEKFTQRMLENNINKILGHDQKTDWIINELPSFQNLSKIKRKNAMDYMTYIMGPNLPIELMDKTLPTLVKQNFENLLPLEMSKGQKDLALSNILSLAYKSYQSCVSPYKERIKFKKDINDKELLKHRKSLESNFCKKNPANCNLNSCTKRKNFITERSDISDTKVIQACVYKGLNETLPFTVGKIIDQQFENYKDQINLSLEEMKGLKKESLKNLKSCIKNDIQKKTAKSYQEALFHLDTKQFKDSLLLCGKGVETDLTTIFATELISALPQVDNKSKAKALAESSISRCLSSQKKRVTHVKMSARLCKPAIEVEAASVIVADEIQNSFKSVNLKNQETNSIISDFEICSNKAKDKLIDGYFSPDKKNRIDSSNAHSYLVNDNTFYHCVLDSLDKSTNLVVDKNVEILKEDIQDKVKDLEYATKLLPYVRTSVKQCIRNGVNSKKNWKEFAEFSSNGDFKNLIDDCKEKATNYTLPKILTNEFALNYITLKAQNLISSNKKDVKKRLSEEFGVPLSVKDSYETLIKKVYNLFKGSSPKEKSSEFIDYFKKVAQEILVEDIHSLAMDRIVRKSKNKRSHSLLKSTLSKECLNTFITLYQDDIKKLGGNPKKGRKTPDLGNLITSFISNGLNRAEKNDRYKPIITRLNRVCKNPEKYKDIKDLVNTGVADEIFISAIQEKVISGFTNNMIGQCQKDLLPLHKYLYQEEIDMLCSYDVKNINLTIKNLDSISNRIIKEGDHEGASNLKFLVQRFFESKNVIDNKLNPALFDKLLSEDREFLNLVYDNFEGITKKDTKTADMINQAALNLLFKDKKPGSFAYEFSRVQVVGAVGILGLEQALGKLDESISEGYWADIPLLNENVQSRALPTFYKYWTPTKLNDYLSWEKIDTKKRNEIIQGILDHKILVRFDSSKKEFVKELSSEMIKTQVTEHINTYNVIPNPKYRDTSKMVGRMKHSANMANKRKKKHISLPEMIKLEITQDIIDQINPLK